ncbi:MAG: HD domain-containing protein [Dehalococcoidia bacterium]
MSLKKLTNIQLTDDIINICRIIYTSGIKSHIVGGFIRDNLLGIKTSDIDITVNNNAKDIGILLAKKTSGKCITLDKKREIYRIITGSHYSPIQIDIAKSPEEIEDDLKARDFTINSMAINISDLIKASQSTVEVKNIIDPHNGIADLEANLLRATSQYSLSEDPVRLIRAIRISSQLDLEITSDLNQSISNQANLIKTTAKERIRAEFLNILKQKNSSKWLKTMDSLSLLSEIIPEIELTKDVIQPKEHYWDVFGHLIESVNSIEKIFDYCLYSQSMDTAIDNEILSMVPVYQSMHSHFNSIAGDGHTRIVTSKLACLLHDIAKPLTKTIDANDRIRFLGHAEKGADISESILRNLKCSNSLTEIVSTQVQYHLRPGQISPKSQMPSNKAINKYFRDLGTVSIDTLYLHMADYMAATGPLLKKSEWETNCLIINNLLKDGLNGTTPDKIPNLISGQDIMDKLNLNPGPLIGNILAMVRDAQEDGIIKSKEDALKYIEKFV